MIAMLMWDAKGEVLRLSIYVPGQARPWPEVWLASIEAIEGGREGCAVTVYEWGTWDTDHEPLPELRADNIDEARRMVAALLGVRGLEVPQWRADEQAVDGPDHAP